MADINDAALITHQRQDNTHSKSSKTCTTTDPKHRKKKIPSFLSGDEEPKAQNKNSVCGLSLRAFVLSLPLGNLLRVACEGHAYPAAGAREDGGRYDTYAVTETPALSGFSPGNRPWRCPRWRAALKALLSPGLKKKTVYMTTDVFL